MVLAKDLKTGDKIVCVEACDRAVGEVETVTRSCPVEICTEEFGNGRSDRDTLQHFELLRPAHEAVLKPGDRILCIEDGFDSAGNMSKRGNIETVASCEQRGWVNTDRTVRNAGGSLRHFHLLNQKETEEKENIMRDRVTIEYTEEARPIRKVVIRGVDGASQTGFYLRDGDVRMISSGSKVNASDLLAYADALARMARQVRRVDISAPAWYTGSRYSEKTPSNGARVPHFHKAREPEPSTPEGGHPESGLPKDDSCPHGHGLQMDCVWVGGPCATNAIDLEILRAVEAEQKRIVGIVRRYGNSDYGLGWDFEDVVRSIIEDEADA